MCYMKIVYDLQDLGMYKIKFKHPKKYIFQVVYFFLWGICVTFTQLSVIVIFLPEWG